MVSYCVPSGHYGIQFFAANLCKYLGANYLFFFHHLFSLSVGLHHGKIYAIIEKLFKRRQHGLTRMFKEKKL